jgi:MOSC domain-containing protein YiiM
MVRRLNIDGDGQGDTAGHGGEQRAVLVYQIQSYRYWQRHFGRQDLDHGQFGENLTVDGLPDDEVCIGDRYRVGAALFEVTQPRVTCYRVGMRMKEPRMPALLTSSGKPGFYFRVLQEGEIEAGDEIVKVADGPERMTVAEINALLYLPGHSPQQLKRALRIAALSAGWRTSFQALLQNESSGSPMTGNPGLTTGGGTPAWAGFRPLRVSRIDRESSSVVSLLLVPADGRPLVAAAPGQFVVLRLRPNPDAPPVLRSYSLSDAPSADHYRVSVKQELNGVASTYVHKHVRVGDVLDVSAPRGSFTLQSGDRPLWT